MKKLIALLLLISPVAYSQEWIKLMNDPDVNFYDVQKSFNVDYKKEQKKENSVLRKIFRWSKDEEKETPGLGVYKRWEHFNAPRVYPSGVRLKPDHVWKEFMKMRAGSGQPSIQSSGNWSPLGPSSWVTNSYNPGIGRVNVVVVDPNDPMIIYIGSPSGGIWKSTDGGSSWNQPTTDKLPSIGVSAIAVDYANTDVIYIGTGDCDASDTYSNGVLKSTDGGLTWNATGLSWSLTQTRKISKLLMDPINHLILYATTNNGIFKTTDGGATWNLILPGGFRDMEFKPGNANVIYICGTAFHKSEDAGATWTLIDAGVPPTGDINRLAIAVTPADTNYVYMAAGDQNSSGFYAMYRSTDGGNTFTQRSSSPNLYGYAMDGSDSGGQSWYSMTLAVSPFNKDEVYTGGVNIWHSDNGGVTWDINTHWYYGGSEPYVHADQHWMDFEDGILYVGCDGGVFMSDDLGNNWNDLSFGLTISQFYRLGGTEADPGMIMAGAQDNGCNLLKNGQWTHVLGADGMEVAISPINTQVIFAESQNGGINRSTNGGVTMSNVVGNINENADWVTPYVVDPNVATTWYAGFENIWRSTNNGVTWSKISNFGTSNVITEIAVAPSNSSYIYTIKGGSLYMTMNAGAVWTNISGGLPTAGASASYIAVDPLDAERLWVTFSGTTAGSKVFHSNDGGTTWINESYNLPNVPVNCIVYQNGTADGLYIGTDLSVFYMDDSLSGWTLFNTDLPNVAVMEMEINYAGSKLRAATYGRGIWESDLFVLTPPQADFTADKTQICPGGEIHFTDLSSQAYPGWQWLFPGGTPSSSTLQNPTVVYANAGTYDAQLIVQNAAGSDTLIRTIYINVSSPSAGTLPLFEGFESGTYPPALWTISNEDGNITWEETTSGGFGTSNHSAAVLNFNQSLVGQKDWLLTPVLDIASLASPYLKFDRAYARIPNRLDSLRIFYTSDCGVTRTYFYSKTGAGLANAGVLNTAFVPTGAQWVSDSVVIPASAGQVQIGFENRNGFGNNLYIDNINIYDNVVGLNENTAAASITVSPNPANEFALLIVNVNEKQLPFELTIRDAAGRVVYNQTITSNGTQQIETTKYQNGFYLMEGIATDKKVIYSGKLNVMH